MDRNHDAWFEDESFWVETYPFMFSEARFASAAENVANIASLAGVASGSVLDLACGPGRYAVPLAKSGYAVTGVDRSHFLLHKARELAASNEVAIEWVQQDMREFRRPEAFDLALSLFTSFGYFDQAADNRRVLENVYASLKPGGVFVFDHLGKEVLAARFQPTLSESLPDGTLLIQRVTVIDDWSRVEGEWIVVKDGRAISFRNCHWLYSGQEISDMLIGVGFENVCLYGSLTKAPYGAQAQRLVAVARKR